MKYDRCLFCINAAAFVFFAAAVVFLIIFANDTNKLLNLGLAFAEFVVGSVLWGFAFIVKAATLYLKEHEPIKPNPQPEKSKPEESNDSAHQLLI